ncbi:MAG: CRISPR system precrRNA processing endoribonuclease RAMP protein Cas6 [Gammaproteobacteria bacterium]|nr:MAG: CRISPR system precrRNA processing endoribonuclease RAMP protein Cas6 [Gammaproteobacteria bacterium]
MRGALGYVLKDVACQVSHKQCDICFLKDICPYQIIFWGSPPANRSILRRYPSIPQPFVLDVPSPGSWGDDPIRVKWALRLFGEAGRWSPYIVETFRRIAKRGIGPRRVPFSIDLIRDGNNGRVIWSDNNSNLTVPVMDPIPPSDQPLNGVVRWHFHTPLHLRVRGRSAQQIEGMDIILAGRRRWQILTHMFGATTRPEILERLDHASFKVVNQQLRGWSIYRYSGRQKRKVRLSGLIGWVDIEGPWHRVGEWAQYVYRIHLGKNTSFGLGRVSWQQISIA